MYQTTCRAPSTDPDHMANHTGGAAPICCCAPLLCVRIELADPNHRHCSRTSAYGLFVAPRGDRVLAPGPCRLPPTARPKRPFTGDESKGAAAVGLAVPVRRPCHAHAAASSPTAPPRSRSCARWPWAPHHPGAAPRYLPLCAALPPARPSTSRRPPGCLILWLPCPPLPRVHRPFT